MSRPVAPPSGWPAPTTATLAGRPISLVPLAEAIADRYFDEFPEDLSRYGVAARQWEIHDTLHCLNWAMLDVEQVASLEREIAFSITAAFEDAELGVFVLADHVVPRLELARRCRELGCPLLVLGLGPRMDFERSRELMRGELVPEDFLSDLWEWRAGPAPGRAQLHRLRVHAELRTNIVCGHGLDSSLLSRRVANRDRDCIQGSTGPRTEGDRRGALDRTA